MKSAADEKRFTGRSAVVSRPLVIGFGNTLRGDDSAGVLAVHALAADGRAADFDALAVHQLTVDLIDLVHDAEVVVFVDATHDAAPGEVVSHRLHAAAAGSALGHALTPAELMAIVRAMTGTKPLAFEVLIGASDFAAGETPSPCVAAAIPRAVETVLRLVREA